ncbi:MAG: class I SAM-dependent methyltransferase [Oryzomonas sp.]|uniref:class I SAM-dependent methyltransferase n=1 Tax=Oryzomonas sp. TaxID=2855186 RepID=UPI00283B5998|nr:class I SAM-dependent methyltransferase [Oryzomonas sp.]MDR3580285.1 class I SAM-dependent methyltransferase [Oryzomonas sp.]
MTEYKDVYVERLYENQGFPALVDLVLPEHHRILDVGCGNGANIYLLLQRGHESIGLTLSEAEARLVTERGFECMNWDMMSEQLPFEEQTFDALLFSHVLEHLPWPEEVLKRYLKLLRPGGGVYIALPNVLHLVQRWQFLGGNFKYTETGTMDRTHLRFFDFASARQLAESCGITVVQHFGVGQCPTGPLREITPGLSRRIDEWTSRYWPSVFGVHIVISGRL